MTAVTLRAKRFIIQCAGCGLLAETSRRDTLVCSPACRVRAHRNCGASAVREMAAVARVPPGLIVRVRAVLKLRPDLADGIRAGAFEIDDTTTQREMGKSFWALVQAQIDAKAEE